MENKDWNRQTASRVDESLKKIDGASCRSPDVLYLNAFVRSEKKKLEKSRRLQFAVFLLVAVSLATASLMCLLSFPVVFALLQAAPFAAFVLWLFLPRKKPGLREGRRGIH